MRYRMGKIGVYGNKTRALQRRLSYEAFGLSAKHAEVFKYLGSRVNATPDIDDVQSLVFFEVPDRAYASTPVCIPIGMELMAEMKTDFTRFGLINPLQDEVRFRVHINDFACLGRPLIVGDVFEIPFFRTEDGKKSFWEITDADPRGEVERFVVIITATPLTASRKTREIPVNRTNDDFVSSVMDQIPVYQGEQVPQRGIHELPVPPVEVDYRDPQQAGFLDDVNKEYDNG